MVDRTLHFDRRVLVASGLDADADVRSRGGGGPCGRAPQRYHQLFRLWFAFGFPAFGAVLAIFWLMIAKPQVELWPFSLAGGS
jgi:hypothetical protein